MHKSIEVLLRGYIVFRVNGEKFYLYHRAKKKRLSLCLNTHTNISFEGYHIFKGWTGFFYRFRGGIMV